MENNSGFIKITGLWKSKTKDGQTYLAGNLSGITQLSVMPNKYKKSDRDPDYYVYIRSSKKKDDIKTTRSNNNDL